MRCNRLPLIATALLGAATLHAQVPLELQIKANSPGPRVSPSLYGLMTEEINYSYEGGLYAELIRNRSMKEDPATPVHWTAVQNGATATIALDPSTPLNDAIATSLKLTVTDAAATKTAGIANDGFWGIPVRPNTRYHASFYAKAAPGFTGPLTVAIAGNDGATVYATVQVPHITTAWQKYSIVLTTTAKAPASADNHFVITTNHPGAIWFNMVSLFPPTYKDRANGNRPDIMQLLADMHPAFLRFPGGNYLEGNTIETRFDWKKTIGDIAQRPGHMDDAWKYWSSDGMGLLEFLNWTEDLDMQPVLAVYAGYSMRPPVRVKSGADLDPYVNDALDEIEYVTGGPNTTWGARRVRDGHPAPFKLEYVEVGNEDNFDREAGSYDARFAQFYSAIKAKYPQLQIIATTKINGPHDVIDEHLYPNSEDDMASRAHNFDARPRTGPKVFVGEWATRVGDPTPNMSGALGDAAWMTGMERNSDLVLMSCYAPLFVNVNPGGMQWKTDLIGYNTMTSYGSPAYYAQQMFSSHHGDVILPVDAPNVPAKEWQPPAGRGRAGAPPPAPRPAQQVPLFFFSATRDTKAGTIYLKVVNRDSKAQPIHIKVDGLKSVDSKGQAFTLAASSPDDTNSISEPKKIVPVTTVADRLGTDFTRSFPPYSITVLEMKAR